MSVMWRDINGFSLVELTIALGVMMVTTGAVFGLLHPALGVSAAEPERADMQQRLRVVTEALTSDLMMAGAGAHQGALAGPLVNYLAPLRPSWHNGASDALTMFFVPQTAVQTTLSAELTPFSSTLQVAAPFGCPLGASLCGIAPGMTLLVYDEAGHADTFAVLSGDDVSASVQITSRPPETAITTYPIGSKVVEAQVHAYSLKTTAAPPSAQLMRASAPVADHIVGLVFEYYADPQPPTLVGGVPTYGPAPPPPAVQTTAYPSGENCTFSLDAAGVHVARLTALTAGNTLTRLSAAQLTDGPWCPDDADSNRWDADLLRIRKISVTVRVEAAPAVLRGPAGVLFTNGGSSRDASRWLPDQEIRWSVSPRNLAAGR
jgi:hypothetical protein